MIKNATAVKAKIKNKAGGDSEMIVVKQSMPVILSGLIGIVALIIPIFLYLVLKLMITYTLQATSIVLTIVTIVVYRKVSHSNYIFSIL